MKIKPPYWLFSSADDSFGVGEFIIIPEKELVDIKSYLCLKDINFKNKKDWWNGEKLIQWNPEVKVEGDGSDGTPVYDFLYVDNLGNAISYRNDLEILIEKLKTPSSKTTKGR